MNTCKQQDIKQIPASVFKMTSFVEHLVAKLKSVDKIILIHTQVVRVKSLKTL